MIVVSIIGLLAALAIPTYIKARKSSQGKRIVNDARIIDAAVAVWAVDYRKQDGDEVDLDQVATYTKSGKLSATDVLGNPYTIGPVGMVQVQISPTTKTLLAGADIDWGPY
jgi:type II secretory pathway pseudopilin PulG